MAGPIGLDRGDIQAAIVASTVANVNRGKKGRKLTPADFIPKWDRGRQQPWQEQLAKAKTITRAMGGVDNTSDNGEGADGGDPVEPVGAYRRRR